jgi:hypothetical protein
MEQSEESSTVIDAQFLRALESDLDMVWSPFLLDTELSAQSLWFQNALAAAHTSADLTSQSGHYNGLVSEPHLNYDSDVDSEGTDSEAEPGPEPYGSRYSILRHIPAE